MIPVSLPVAYVPLVDAAPLIIAQDMGFAAAEGISLDLISAPSWSSVRDMLAFGRVDAAHLLSPMPVAMGLGLGGVTTELVAPYVLSANGNVIGVGRTLEARLREAGYGFDFTDAAAAAAALAAVLKQDGNAPVTFGAPFPFSMHVELLRYWFDSTPLRECQIDIRVVPPPMMAQALADGDVDAFCVGEPWGSVAVEQGAGALILPGKAIWEFAPEKVLAVRRAWAETEPHLLSRLMQALWRAGRWLSQPDSRTTAAEILSRPEWLGIPPELIDRALSGRFTISTRAEQREVEGFLNFHDGAANFPWRSQAKWIADRIALANGLDRAEAQRIAGGIFRADLYREHMAGGDVDLPGASEKLEGSIRHGTAVASHKGGLILQPDRFFDGRIFDPIPDEC